jgi:hypothetical protein
VGCATGAPCRATGGCNVGASIPAGTRTVAVPNHDLDQRSRGLGRARSSRPDAPNRRCSTSTVPLTFVFCQVAERGIASCFMTSPHTYIAPGRGPPRRMSSASKTFALVWLVRVRRHHIRHLQDEALWKFFYRNTLDRYWLTLCARQSSSSITAWVGKPEPARS